MLLKSKPWRMVTLGTLSILCLLSFHCRRSSKVSAVEFNDPWITICPMLDQHMGHGGRLSPYQDRNDPNILYFAEVMGKGEALRVDMTTKDISSYKFNVEKWEDINNFANEFKLGFYGKSTFGNSENRPVRSEFRGEIVSRKVFHMFGYPVANQPGTTISKFGTGTWTLIDNYENKDRELVRYQITNAETNDWGFGDMDCEVSPDGKWVVYRLPAAYEPIFIFRRGQRAQPGDRWVTFQPDYGAFNAKLGVFKDRH